MGIKWKTPEIDNIVYNFDIFMSFSCSYKSDTKKLSSVHSFNKF